MKTMNATVKSRDTVVKAMASLAISVGPLMKAAMNHKKPRQTKTSKTLLPKMFEMAISPYPSKKCVNIEVSRNNVKIPTL